VLALLAADGPANRPQSFAAVTGGHMIWQLVARSNESRGDAEIWAAQATSKLSNVQVTATLNSGSFHGRITVISIPGVERVPSVGATGHASAKSGNPSLTLQAVSPGSLVYAVGNDWDNAVPRTVGPGQTLISQSVDTRVNDTFWAQRFTAPSTTTSVSVSDTAPTSDEWNLAAVAVSPDGGSSTGASVPSSPGTTTESTQTPTDTPTPTTAPTAIPPPTQGSNSTPYVQPGTQGYRGSVAALTVYSAANGNVPSSACSWVVGGDSNAKYLKCHDSNLTLDHAYIQGSLYWEGCGTLTITNSVVDWKPGFWFSVYAACSSPGPNASVTAVDSTFETADDIAYTGLSDIGAIDIRGDMPMFVRNSLLKDFPQGLNPDAGSVIMNNEIYARSSVCWLNSAANTTSSCHNDGLFSSGGNNIVYQGNYISVPDGSTAAIFYQSDPNSTGNKVIGNFLKGGSFTLYNEDSNGLDVENNTFGGYTYNDAALCSGSWGNWTGNVHPDGSVVAAPARSCSY